MGRRDRHWFEALVAGFAGLPLWAGPVFAVVVFGVLWLIGQYGITAQDHTNELIRPVAQQAPYFGAVAVLFAWLIAVMMSVWRKLDRALDTMGNRWAAGRDAGAQEATSPTTAPTCPVCGADMVRRVAKRGVSAGREFWGCARYPACRGTRPLDGD